MAVDINALLIDLDAETAVLTACLGALTEGAWGTATPAAGWDIKDQVGHLAYFDQTMVRSVTDPDGFRIERDAVKASTDSIVDAATAKNRGRSGAEIGEWFVAARAEMRAAFAAADPSAKVPWFGPDMSMGSAVTSRIMETWAHGQDVFDGLGQPHPVSSALRQVAHIGVRALPNSFRTRDLPVPDAPVRLVLDAGDEQWVWGPDAAVDRVSGSAIDFCLVVTQRRHLNDTALVIEGLVASAWMPIAQAYAGAAGTGREAGQFRG